MKNTNWFWGLIITGVLIGQSTQAQFRNVTEEWGFAGGGKAAFGDFDGDGFVDLYAGKLWRNVDGKKFVEAKESGAPGGEVIFADFDNDGHLDLFQFTGGGSLHRNTGKGKFEAVKFPKLPTVNSRGAVWLDINNDARLDLFVGGTRFGRRRCIPMPFFSTARTASRSIGARRRATSRRAA